MARSRPLDDLARTVEVVLTGVRLVGYRAMPHNPTAALGLGIPGQLEHDVEFKRLTVAVPPSFLALMARAEIDFGPVREGQLDLNHVVGAAGGTLQRRNRGSSSPTHSYKSSSPI